MAGQHASHMRFIADKMLGRLAKWLRILGFDTVYLPIPSLVEIKEEVQAGRVFLTRSQGLLTRVEAGVLIASDRVEDQLRELCDAGCIELDDRKWFSRCIRCNEALVTVSREEVDCLVPEYVRLTAASFALCPLCGRIYWPGSHSARIEERIRWMSEETVHRRER